MDCSLAIFNTEEREILEKYGHWFKALISGELEPYTEKQRLFMKWQRRKTTRLPPPPPRVEEKTWFKYTKRKEIEEKHGQYFWNSRPELESDPFLFKRRRQAFLRKSSNEHNGKKFIGLELSICQVTPGRTRMPTNRQQALHLKFSPECDLGRNRTCIKSLGKLLFYPLNYEGHFKVTDRYIH